jgi:hypothetical protein
MNKSFTILIVICITISFNCFSADVKDESLGFWQISPSGFTAEEPFIIQSPVPSKGKGFLYIWPFSFKYTASLNNVLRHLKGQLSAVRNDNKKEELLKRSIAKVEKELKGGIPRIRLYISLYTESDKTYHDISSPLIRNMAEVRMGRKLHTISDIASGKFEKNETVNGIAIFEGVDPDADNFEILVTGLGKRIVPSYYPGHILKAGLPYDAKLRKAIRFKYARPGDAATRAISKVKLISRKNDWIWLWANEIYPMKANDLILERNVETDDGTKKLVYNYKYFPYEIFNSTPESRIINISKAGISLKLKWQGLSFSVNMIENVSQNNFRKSQAINKLKTIEPDYFGNDSSRHVNGEIKPGKIAKGIALMKWGVSDPTEIIKNLVNNIRINAEFLDNSKSKVIQDYKKIKGELTNAKSGLLTNTKTVSDENIIKLILNQSEEDLKEKEISPSDADIQRYGSLANFAVLINNLSENKLNELSESGRMSVYFAVKVDNITDSARFERLTDIGRPVEINIDTSISTEVTADTTETGGGFTDEKSTDADSGDTEGEGGDDAVDLW